MPALTNERIAELLQPFLPEVSAKLSADLLLYLDLLLKWNAKTNLTAIREPEAIVGRHFGESLFAGRLLRESLGSEASVLDFGSGAGFPGLPMQMLEPGWRVTLAESQGKKAAFLREAVRTLGLSTAEVWGQRAETLPADRLFHAITLRAVDDPKRALVDATPHVVAGGWIAHLHGGGAESGSIAIPESKNRWVTLTQMCC